MGADALLQCHYDLEGGNLYALKWYKGSHEFYSYVPKEMPSIRVFPWTQFLIHAEEWRSGTLGGRVLLKNITADAGGTYKCEVSTEAPSFDTDYKQANLTIVGESGAEWDSSSFAFSNPPLPDGEYARRTQPVVSSLPGQKWARNCAGISSLHFLMWSVLLFH